MLNERRPFLGPMVPVMAYLADLGRPAKSQGLPSHGVGVVALLDAMAYLADLMGELRTDESCFHDLQFAAKCKA